MRRLAVAVTIATALVVTVMVQGQGKIDPAIKTAPAWEAALVGYALLGAGCSNIVPVLYTAVGKQTVMPESIAVPAITTLGYAGILAGPAVIGFIAHGSSLSFAFGLMAVLLVAVAIGGKVLKV